MNMPFLLHKRSALLSVAALSAFHYHFGSSFDTSVTVDAFVAPYSCKKCKDLPSFGGGYYRNSWVLSATSKTTTSTSTSSSEREIPAITERIQSLTQNPNIAIVIDVENVRGKTGFELDHADLLDRLMVWTTLRNYAFGRTLVVVDHGSKSSAHLLHHSSSANTNHDAEKGEVAMDTAALCVSFAGPNVKADDIIARDVRWLLSSPECTTQHVVVITADQELAWRCRSATRSFLGSDSDSIGGGTKLNSVLRSFATDNSNIHSGGENKGSKSGKIKSGRKKKSRAARKKQYLESVQEPSEEDGEQIDNDLNATDSTTDSNVTFTDTYEERSNITIPTVEIIAPQRFLEDLEQASHEWLQLQQEQIAALEDAESNNNISSNSNPPIIPTPVATLQNLFELRGQILSLESMLRRKCSLHKRHTLTGELRKCKEEWKEILSTLSTNDSDDAERLERGNAKLQQHSLVSSLAWSLSSTISSWDNDAENDTIPLSPFPQSSAPSASTIEMSWEQLPPKEQEKLLMRWGKRRGRTGTRREKTEDRIVMAERLRRQLELILVSNDDTDGLHSKQQLLNGDEEGQKTSLAEMYAGYINNMMNDDC